MSKGSNRRKEDVKKILDNWDAIFGNKDPKQEKPKQEVPKENAK